jgi:hypothetical protein
LGKKFKSIDLGIGIRKMASSKIKGMAKNWSVLKKYKEKWERVANKVDESDSE